MFLSRVLCPDGQLSLVLRQGSEAALVHGDPDLCTLARRAMDDGVALIDLLLQRRLGAPVDVAGLLAQGRLLSPLPDGPALLLPAGLAEDQRPLTRIAPGQGLGLVQGGALEGGVAAVFVTGGAGRDCLIGWTMTHVGMNASVQSERVLCCGPELCLLSDERPGAGQARLLRDEGTLIEFGIPDAGRLPEGEQAVANLPAGTVVIRRLSRWLLRPRADYLDAVVESRVAGLGMALRNPLSREGAGVMAPADTVRRQA